MTSKIKEDRFIELYCKTHHYKTLGTNAKALFDLLESMSYIEVEEE